MKALVTLPLNERQREKLEKNCGRVEFSYCPLGQVTEEHLKGMEAVFGNVDPGLFPSGNSGSDS